MSHSSGIESRLNSRFRGRGGEEGPLVLSSARTTSDEQIKVTGVSHSQFFTLVLEHAIWALLGFESETRIDFLDVAGDGTPGTMPSSDRHVIRNLPGFRALGLEASG